VTRDRTPRLSALTHALEMRWRLLVLAERAVDATAVGMAVAFGTLVVDVIFALDLPIMRITGLAIGAALVAALVQAALVRRTPERFLVDADRVYGLKSLLVSGFEFGAAGQPDGSERSEFQALVAGNAEAATEEIEPARVYPWTTPRRSGAVAALVVALGIMLILDASAWFDRPVPPYAAEAIALRDAGRRLAARARDDEELRRLAEEIQRLSEEAERGAIDPEEARRRIDRLSERVEQQMRSLGRTPPFEYDEDAQMPPETEETVRRALESGMSEGEVVEFFARMRSEGSTLPDIVEGLEEATPDREPNANLDRDDEAMNDLMDRLNESPPATDQEPDPEVAEQLRESQRALDRMSEGLPQLSEGEDRDIGRAPGFPDRPRDESEEPPDPAPEGAQGDSDSTGQRGGTEAVDDAMDDDFRPPEDGASVFSEIQGVVTDNTIMDIIIRELPSEATAELTEQERDVLFERIIEEAVGRDEVPPELRRLLRNYFLRLTLASRQGAEDEQ